MKFKEVCAFWKRALNRFFYNLSRAQFDQIIADIKSWWYYRHDGYRDVLFYDEENKRYKIERTTISVRQFRPEDLPIVGKKYRRFYTDLEAPFREETRKEVIDGVEYEFQNPTAISNYLFMVNNDLNDAIKGDLKKNEFNPLIMLALFGIGAVILVYFLFFKGGF